MHRLASRFQEKAVLAGVNIDEIPAMAISLGIRSIPTLIIYKDSKEIQRFVGLESDVRRHQDVARLDQRVVRRERFLVEDIECGTNTVFFECPDQRGFVHHAPSRRIDQTRTGFHQGEFPHSD